MKRIRAHLTYANATATLALLFALSGGAIAATGGFSSGGKLQACVNEEGGLKLLKAGKHCKRGQKTVAWNVTGPAGATGSAGANGAQGAAGAAGAQGKDGAKGPDGTAVAFAHITPVSEPKAILDSANSKNILAASEATTTPGLYCITTAVPIRNATGMVDFGNETKSPQSVQANFTLLPLAIGLKVCPSGTNVLLATPNTAGADEKADFWVTFN